MKIHLQAPLKLANILALGHFTSRDGPHDSQRLRCPALHPRDHSQQPQIIEGFDDSLRSRRIVVQAAALLSVLACTPQANAAKYVRVELPAGREIPDTIRQYWAEAVAAAAQQIDPDFKSRLVVYGVTPNLPSGIPGDPAKDYQSSRKGGDKEGLCGPFRPGSLKPYNFCPVPGETPESELARECCRHFAFCVPYNNFGLAVEDRVSTIVVAPRLLVLPPERWQAILAHELGHAVDFHLFGSRFRLRDHKAVAATAELATALRDIDEEPDFEVRADRLGELLVLQPRGQKLCYDPILTLQTLTEPSVACDGDEGSGGGGLLRHYSHEALQGSGNLRL